MTKSIAAFVIALLTTLNIAAQDLPVKWTFQVEPSADGTHTVVATATLDDGWSVYSQHTESGGPIATSFSYVNADPLTDTAEESPAPTKEFSELFELEVQKFKGKATFTQKVQTHPEAKMLKVSVRYMCCDDTKCLPPTVQEFAFQL